MTRAESRYPIREVTYSDSRQPDGRSRALFATSKAANAFARHHKGSTMRTTWVTYEELVRLRNEGKLEYGG